MAKLLDVGVPDAIMSFVKRGKHQQQPLIKLKEFHKYVTSVPNRIVYNVSKKNIINNFFLGIFFFFNK